MPKKRPKRSPAPCPRCGGLDVVRIVYGLPMQELVDLANQGKVALGGCIVTGNDPQKHCNACGFEFDLPDGRRVPATPSS